MTKKVPLLTRIKITRIFAKKIGDTLKYSSMEDAAIEAGEEAGIKGGVCYHSIRVQWAPKCRRINRLLQQGLLRRAESYNVRAELELENLERKMFYQNETFGTQEVKTMVNKAKLVIDHCKERAAKMCPEVYGDYYHEIKKIQENMRSLSQQVDKMAKNMQ